MEQNTTMAGNPMAQVNISDIIVIVAYFVLNVAVGIWVRNLFTLSVILKGH